MYTVIVTRRATGAALKSYDTSDYYAALTYAGQFDRRIYQVEIYEW